MTRKNITLALLIVLIATVTLNGFVFANPAPAVSSNAAALKAVSSPTPAAKTGPLAINVTPYDRVSRLPNQDFDLTVTSSDGVAAKVLTPTYQDPIGVIATGTFSFDEATGMLHGTTGNPGRIVFTFVHKDDPKVKKEVTLENAMQQPTSVTAMYGTTSASAGKIVATAGKPVEIKLSAVVNGTSVTNIPWQIRADKASSDMVDFKWEYLDSTATPPTVKPDPNTVSVYGKKVGTMKFEICPAAFPEVKQTIEIEFPAGTVILSELFNADGTSLVDIPIATITARTASVEVYIKDAKGKLMKADIVKVETTGSTTAVARVNASTLQLTGVTTGVSAHVLTLKGGRQLTITSTVS
jgi:hypothetical protein